MTFKSKEEFAHAIIDAGEDGLVNEQIIISFNPKCRQQFIARRVGFPVEHLAYPLARYNEDWQPYVKPIPDKALVWCWDNTDVACRELRVYITKKESTYSYDGIRKGVMFSNYKQLTPEEIQPWMQELIDNCEE